jgi:cytochrome c
MKAIKLCLFIALACCIMAAISGCQPNPSPIIKPEDNRFTTEVLASNLDEPMQFEMLADGRVLFAERKGKLKVYDPIVRKVTIIADIPVRHSFAGYTSSGTHESEDGILGVLLDPQFNSNHWIYLFYAPENRGPKDVLSRFEWNGSTVNLASEKVLLEVPLDTSVCCHLGGGMVFDNNGNLLVATGENGQADDGYSTLDERPGHETSDAQRTSANSNSFNGKILRIHPERDGTYTIPPGNLFPPGTDKTRPEIYTMGNRNPWRLNIDFKTGWLYWGEVGPNGDEDSEERGPRAYDEFNQAKAAGNFGYPHFIADNKAYRRYDFSSGKAGNTFDPLRPTNLSRNNTGINELPPAKPAFIWYPYRASDSFPLLGTGAMSAVGGPIYRHAKFPNAEHPFPKYFEGKWFITDWVRGWIMAVSMDDNGSYKSMEPFLPAQKHYGIIDMDFGPDGSLYLLEYGTGVFRASPEARLVRIS